MTNEQQMYVEIGRILMAHQSVMDLRFHLKGYLRESGHDLEAARRDVREYGMYGDCGPSYEDDYAEAKGIEKGLKVARNQVDRKEKYVKLLKHEFKAKYPESYDLMIQELNASIIKVGNYLNEKLYAGPRKLKQAKRERAMEVGRERALVKQRKLDMEADNKS